MRILVVGGGGREHALCWALSRNATVFCAPGNPGTRQCATNLPESPKDHAGIAAAIRREHIDLTVVGPEAPLAEGLVDHLATAGLHAFGPTKAAARIEACKAFAKEVMARAGVPTASYGAFSDEAEALRYIEAHDEPMVVKASGLAAGKGAVVCSTRADACSAAHSMLRGTFGDACPPTLVEWFGRTDPSAWRESLAAPQDEQVMSKLRLCTTRNRPLGGYTSLSKLEPRLGRRPPPPPPALPPTRPRPVPPRPPGTPQTGRPPH